MIQRSLFRAVQTASRQPSTMQASRHATSPFTAIRPITTPVSSQASPFVQRWYSQTPESDAKKQETLESQAEAQGQGDSTKDATPKDDPIAKELEAKKKEVVDLNDRLKRTVADFRNLQEQTKREIKASRDFALQGFAKDLLDSIDNLDRALSTVPADKLTDANADLVNLHSGLKMTDQILMSTLKKHGMERFDPAEAGDKFDPNKMEATFQAPQQGKEDGAVFYTQSKGFIYNGRVLRAAKVGVVKNS